MSVSLREVLGDRFDAIVENVVCPFCAGAAEVADVRGTAIRRVDAEHGTLEFPRSPMFDHEGAYDRVELEVAAEVTAGQRDDIDWHPCRPCNATGHPTVGQLAHWGAAAASVAPERVLKCGVEYAAGADARVKHVLNVGKAAAKADRPAGMVRCDHQDGVGQRCLRPAGHPGTFAGWFTDGSHNQGHDYGGVATDALTPTEWAALTAGVR